VSTPVVPRTYFSDNPVVRAGQAVAVIVFIIAIPIIVIWCFLYVPWRAKLAMLAMFGCFAWRISSGDDIAMMPATLLLLYILAETAWARLKNPQSPFAAAPAPAPAWSARVSPCC